MKRLRQEGVWFFLKSALTRRPWPQVLLASALAAAVFIAYLPSLDNGFVNWDDDAHLVDNPFLESLSPAGLAEIFTTTVNKIYIPLTSLSFALERHFFGLDPFIYHWHNLSFHILVTLGVLVLGRFCGLSTRAAAAAALLFGIHPMHVESVAWVTERKDVLSAFFYIGALIVYLRYRFSSEAQTGRSRKAHLGLLLGVLVLGLLSALAKPMALSLPLALLLLDVYTRRPGIRRALWEKVLLAGLMFPVIWMTYAGQARVPDIRFPDSLYLWIWSFAFYIKKFFYPEQFTLIYSPPEPLTLFQPEVLSAIGVLLVFVVTMILFRHRREVVLAGLFYAATIFFLLRLDQAADTNIVADRFMYIPSIGFCLLLGAAWDRVFLITGAGRWGKMAFLFLSLAAAVVLGHKTMEQNEVWHNGVTLWEHQLKLQPRARTGLALVKLADARMDQPEMQALLCQIRSCRTGTADAELCRNVEGEYPVLDAAVSLYWTALGLDPRNVEAWYGLGRSYAAQGDSVPALECLRRTLEANPRHFNAWLEVGKVQQGEGNKDASLAAYAMASKISPDNKALRRRIAALKSLGVSEITARDCAQAGEAGK